MGGGYGRQCAGTVTTPKSISSQETIQAMNYNQQFNYNQKSSSSPIIGQKTNMYKKFSGYKDLYSNQKLNRKILMEKRRCSSFDDHSRRSIFLIIALLLICTFLVISAFLIKRLYFDNFT
uniref:Transmembrane protein n=1 Tax=Romanomermis culicivorax TaxID=13658 RepID=A0A915KI63_ROMCU